MVLSRTYSLRLWLILMGLVGYYGYLMYWAPEPCAQPIIYRIGSVDPGFNISAAEFQTTIERASKLWEEASGKDLFVYDPKGSLDINLLYDTRQENTEKIQKLTSEIQSTGAIAASVKAQYMALVSQYQKAKDDYEISLSEIKKDQAAYNKDVAYWNSRGGAPQKEYQSLEAERQALHAEQQSVDAKRVEVNRLASQINALIDKYNLLVSHINENVDTINQNELTGTTFEEGLYVSNARGEYIDIYQFDNAIYFERVIAHELGHALGIEHNNNPDSIMNPINRSQSLALTADDVADLRTACKLHMPRV